jgi:hypothetical protein
MKTWSGTTALGCRAEVATPRRAARPFGVLLALAALAHPASAQSSATRSRADLQPPVTYYIARGTPESGFQEGDLTLARWALEAWGRRLDPAMKFAAAPEDSATIRVHFVSAAEGSYGEMRARRVGDRVVAEVYIHPDTEGLGADIAAQARQDPLFRDAIVYLTVVHELGHVFGLPHTRAFADIMYSFQYGGDFVAYFMRFRDQLEHREDIRLASPFSPADEAAFRALYR